MSFLFIIPALVLLLLLSPSDTKQLLEDSVGQLRGSRGSCTATSIAPEYFLTAQHCLQDSMTVDGKEVAVLASSRENDLALLWVPGLVKPSLSLARSVKRGDEVVGAGFGATWTPKGPRVMLLFTFSKVSAFYEGWTLVYGDFVDGMSGGPVVNKYGELVTIVQWGDEVFGYGPSLSILADFIEKALPPTLQGHEGAAEPRTLTGFPDIPNASQIVLPPRSELRVLPCGG